MLPGLSWSAPQVTAPEPGILSLVAGGGIAAFAEQFMRRKK
jgi:purine nucleoside permease